MRKNIKAIILLFGMSTAMFSQSVLNASDFTENLTFPTYYMDVPSFNPGPAGENQTWDFSAIIPNTTPFTVSFVQASSTPVAASFPEANYCWKSTFSSDIGYEFFNLTNEKIEKTGYAQNTSFINNYVDYDTMFEFPFTYGTSFNDTYQKCPTCPIVSKNISYDAYGTLITSFGTYTNVIRRKLIQTANPDYLWFTVNPFRPIIAGRVGTTENVLVYLSPILNTSQNNFNSKFLIYPNPIDSYFTVQNLSNTKEDLYVSIYDVLGNKIISDRKIIGNSISINLSEFSSGFYFLKVLDSNDQLLYSEKIIKK